QRLAIVVWSYFATMHQLGSHFDMHLLETRELGGLDLPIFGVHQPETPFDRWLWPILIPQLTVWIVITVVLGIVLGAVPRWWSSRKGVVVMGRWQSAAPQVPFVPGQEKRCTPRLRCRGVHTQRRNHAAGAGATRVPPRTCCAFARCASRLCTRGVRNPVAR